MRYFEGTLYTSSQRHQGQETFDLLTCLAGEALCHKAKTQTSFIASLFSPTADGGQLDVLFCSTETLLADCGHFDPCGLSYVLEALVVVEAVLVRVTFPAVHAAVRLFPSVCSKMYVQRAFLGEAFATVRTAVGLLPRVHALVKLQVGFLCKPLAADAAAERLLARVPPYVHF